MKSKPILLETLLVMTIAVAGMLLLPPAKSLFALLPVAYLLIEKALRKRTWENLGFKFRSFLPDLRANWVLWVAVAIISQPLTLLLALQFLPDVFDHILGRLPFDTAGADWVALLPLLAVSVLTEEMIYRNLLQGRLTPFTGAPLAVVISAAVFSLVHFAPGDPVILMFDLGTIFIDGLLLGVIYARTNNIILTWSAHLVGNTLGMLALLMLAL